MGMRQKSHVTKWVNYWKKIKAVQGLELWKRELKQRGKKTETADGGVDNPKGRKEGKKRFSTRRTAQAWIPKKKTMSEKDPAQE